MNCIIFDLDGTLLYTLEGLFLSTNYALEKFGYKQRSLSEIQNFVGDGVKKLIERATGETNVQEVLEVFLEHYSKTMVQNTKPYEGVIEMLQKLRQKGIKIAINSNKYQSATVELSKKYFPNLIDFVQGEDKNCPKKPSAQGVELITKNLGAKKVLFVGDSLVDIQTAKNAKIPCISVSWGYCDKKILKEYNENIANNPSELLDKILSFF